MCSILSIRIMLNVSLNFFFLSGNKHRRHVVFDQNFICCKDASEEETQKINDQKWRFNHVFERAKVESLTVFKNECDCLARTHLCASIANRLVWIQRRSEIHSVSSAIFGGIWLSKGNSISGKSNFISALPLPRRRYRSAKNQFADQWFCHCLFLHRDYFLRAT